MPYYHLPSLPPSPCPQSHPSSDLVCTQLCARMAWLKWRNSPVLKGSWRLSKQDWVAKVLKINVINRGCHPNETDSLVRANTQVRSIHQSDSVSFISHQAALDIQWVSDSFSLYLFVLSAISISISLLFSKVLYFFCFPLFVPLSLSYLSFPPLFLNNKEKTWNLIDLYSNILAHHIMSFVIYHQCHNNVLQIDMSLSYVF